MNVKARKQVTTVCHTDIKGQSKLPLTNFD